MRVVTGLSSHQTRLGIESAVAAPATFQGRDELAAAGVKFYEWEASRLPLSGFVASQRKLGTIVAHYKPDVVHLHSSKAGLVGRARLRGSIPTVFQPHAWSFEALPPGLDRAALTLERLCDRWHDLVICGSVAESELGVTAGIKHIRTVANGVDTTYWQPRSQHEARARLGLEPGRPLVTCVGRLAKQKGQDLLLGIWPEILQSHPDALLVLVGDGPAEADLRTMSRGVPGVTFAGGTKDPRDWYAASDVVALPSRWEGAALVPLEAMAMGRSVVGTDVGGLLDRLGQGAVVELRHSDRLATLIASRLDSPDRRAVEGRKNADVVTRQFSAQVAYEQMTAVYSEIARS
ncbi:glycosyltransferase [Terrabacter sp. RAF57]|uniref:glycosyltransferase n=1 Tax=Terrabacter sp. RAF57 TaxID=3233063 RepID=UPI003F9BC8AE